jgi:hypothetical protein
LVNEREVNMTKYKIPSIIIGILLIIGMNTNTSFAQSNSESNFLHISVHSSKQADYSIDSHYFVIPAISKEIIQDKLKDNVQLIDTNITGMLPESQANGLIDPDKVAKAAEKDADKAAKATEKDTDKAAKATEKDIDKAAKTTEKDIDKAAKATEKDAKKDAKKDA